MPRIGFSPATKGTYSKEVDIPADNLGLPNDFPPSLVDQDNITLYAFTVDTDRMTCKFEIPSDYAGGGPTNRNSVDVGAVEWNVVYGAGPPVIPKKRIIVLRRKKRMEFYPSLEL